MLSHILTLGSGNAPQLGDYSGFFDRAIIVLQIFIIAMGAWQLAQGLINLFQAQGDGGDPRAKNQGTNQLIAGAAIVIVGVFLIPMLANLFPDL